MIITHVKNQQKKLSDQNKSDMIMSIKPSNIKLKKLLKNPTSLNVLLLLSSGHHLNSWISQQKVIYNGSVEISKKWHPRQNNTRINSYKIFILANRKSFGNDQRVHS